MFCKGGEVFQRSTRQGRLGRSGKGSIGDKTKDRRISKNTAEETESENRLRHLYREKNQTEL